MRYYFLLMQLPYISPPLPHLQMIHLYNLSLYHHDPASRPAVRHEHSSLFSQSSWSEFQVESLTHSVGGNAPHDAGSFATLLEVRLKNLTTQSCQGCTIQWRARHSAPSQYAGNSRSTSTGKLLNLLQQKPTGGFHPTKCKAAPVLCYPSTAQ
jgi:hypothetical protein